MIAQSFAVGLILAGLGGAAVYVAAGEDRGDPRLCQPFFARELRPTPAEWERLRKAVYAREGKPYDHSSFEVDHVVSVGLNGTNTLDNLQLQSWTGPWNAHDKDNLERELNRRFCGHRMELPQAQAMLRTNWCASYIQIFHEVPESAKEADIRPRECGGRG